MLVSFHLPLVCSIMPQTCVFSRDFRKISGVRCRKNIQQGDALDHFKVRLCFMKVDNFVVFICRLFGNINSYYDFVVIRYAKDGALMNSQVQT